jgi:beta-glucanase (GH16 family)
MRTLLLLTLIIFTADKKTSGTDDYTLVWSDEFNKDGAPDPGNWNYEKGFVRNHELQYYQPENAWCEKGNLIIEARKENKPNPGYVEGSNDWRKNRPVINYTSTCMRTSGLKSWQYGRLSCVHVLISVQAYGLRGGHWA